MIYYTIYEQVGRNKERKELCEFGFSKEPRAGDTIEVEGEEYTLSHRCWLEGGEVVLIAKSMGIVLC